MAEIHFSSVSRRCRLVHGHGGNTGGNLLQRHCCLHTVLHVCLISVSSAVVQLFQQHIYRSSPVQIKQFKSCLKCLLSTLGYHCVLQYRPNNKCWFGGQLDKRYLSSVRWHVLANLIKGIKSSGKVRQPPKLCIQQPSVNQSVASDCLPRLSTSQQRFPTR